MTISRADLDQLMADTYGFDLEEQAAMERAKTRIHREHREYMHKNKKKGERHHHESKPSYE